MRSGYKHFKNHGESGDKVFASATVLDFAHIFRNPEHADLMAASILSDSRFYGAPLHAFVVMSNHIHLVFSVPADKTAPWFMNRLKSNSGKRLKRFLSAEGLALLSSQSGLHRHEVWLEGYRSSVLNSHSIFVQKIRYTHLNPVRAKVCERAEDYRWSSAGLIEGRWNPQTGIAIYDPLINRFCSAERLSLRPSSSGEDEG